MKRRPHRQSPRRKGIVDGAARREVVGIVSIILIAGTQPDYRKLTALRQ